jgi:uncharacterized membrane protein HdeD (DUF308 family)
MREGMEKPVKESSAKFIKYGYYLFTVGFIFLATGIWVLISPLSSYLKLSLLFSISFIISGIIDIIFSLLNIRNLDGWGWSLVSGIGIVSIGFLLIMNPSISINTLHLYVGFTLFFRSILAIGNSLDLGATGVSGSFRLLVIGGFGFLFSYILLWDSIFSGSNLMLWTAAAFSFLGIFTLYHSLHIRKMNRLGSRMLT